MSPAGARRAALSVDDLEELVRLYRQTTSDLAIARRDFPADRVTAYVNLLVTRSYGVVYRDPPASTSRLRRFFLRDLPRRYREAWPYLLASAAFLFIPMIVVAVAVLLRPDNAALVVSSSLLDQIKAGQTWFASPPGERPGLASFIMTHNLEIAALAFGVGISGGIGTVLILAFNGLSLGGIAGALIAYGLGDQLIGFVGPHGFIELSVVVVAGAGGLMLGRAIVWPGLLARGEALTTAATRAAQLVLGLLPFLVIAGTIEGFVSPSAFGWPYKLAIGVATAVLLYGYLLGVGRTSDPASLQS